jgi:hypothetical protein
MKGRGLMITFYFLLSFLLSFIHNTSSTRPFLFSKHNSNSFFTSIDRATIKHHPSRLPSFRYGRSSLGSTINSSVLRHNDNQHSARQPRGLDNNNNNNSFNNKTSITNKTPIPLTLPLLSPPSQSTFFTLSFSLAKENKENKERQRQHFLDRSLPATPKSRQQQ